MKSSIGMLCLTAVLITPQLMAESVSYRAHAAKDGTPLAEGTRNYQPATDIVVTKGTKKDGTIYWSKTLSLFDDFGLGAHVERTKDLDGIGLFVRNSAHPNGFSWEWFVHDTGPVYRKLQGPGRVRVAVKEQAGSVELVSVEFLDDITLRYLDDMSKRQPGDVTQMIIIKKGSVLRLVP